jgi:hypothetical protein
MVLRNCSIVVDPAAADGGIIAAALLRYVNGAPE